MKGAHLLPRSLLRFDQSLGEKEQAEETGGVGAREGGGMWWREVEYSGGGVVVVRGWRWRRNDQEKVVEVGEWHLSDVVVVV